MVVKDSANRNSRNMTDLIPPPPPKGASVTGRNTNLGLPVDRKHRLKHRFEVVKKLGQGTYGKVQLAVNKESGQEVAIKTIKKSKIESDQDLVRIRREIQIMSSVQHPHIIHIYEVFENKEKIVLVMQYASGGELYDYLSEKKILNDNEARRIFRQIAAAIYYCHKNKICHRDLKLENVLIDERGNAKIADFGLSNVFDDRHLLATYCGSPLYASPEIVKGTPYYGPEVDCWSMGVLLYTLVYGAMPFDGSNFKRLVKQISEGDYYEPKKKSEATGLIRRLLTVNPTKRATIIDICSDWWVNTGYEHSLLQVAEDTANLTPVRLDLLLALAPVSPPPVAGNKFKPSFTTPTVAEGANVSSGVEDSCEEAPGSHEENGEMSSNSFAYVSGGMASEMNVSSENPDDIFHQEHHDASDEEFLSADLAAALEGQCIKRPAEKSFDGSMVRVSSIAHKSKKPKKSDSLAASKKNFVGVSTLSPDTASSSAKRTDEEVEPITQITKTDTLTAVDQVMAEVDHEKTPEPEPVKHIEPTPPEVVPTEKPKEEEEQQAKTDETETVKKEPAKKKVVKKATETGDGTATKEKKVKRKIVSSSAKKAAEKAETDTTPPPKRSESPSKTRAESPLKLNQRAESPAKSRSPVKGNKSQSPSKTVKAESPAKTKTSESPSRTTKTSESPSRSIKSSESPTRTTKASESPSRSTKTSASPSRTVTKSTESPPKTISPKDAGESTEKKEIKKSGTTPGRILIRKRSETSPEKKPLETKPAAIGAARKPGKLVMPRFLEPTANTPSPKIAPETPKKLVIPIRSVSDAKKAFEVKTKPTPSPATTKKTTETTPPKDDKASSKVDTEVPEDKEKTSTNTEEAKDTVTTVKVSDDDKEKQDDSKETEARDIPPVTTEAENTVKPEVKKDVESAETVKEDVKTSSDQISTEAKPSEETEEEKKIAAKSILKKTLARARLAERKLSQQSSMDSDAGSQCGTPPASLVSTPTSQGNASSYFKIPKPYSKDNVANVESKAEITLGKKANDKKEPNNKNAREETIWGAPMTPSSSNSNSKLKRSVLSSSIESDMNSWRTEVEESLKRLSPEGAAEENHSYTSQTSQDSDGGTGPAPITRSYKKFTFTKDGSTITETGEVYTEPKPDGTWTKVEKKTKVTTNQTPVIPERKFDKKLKETSPLRHSDSQSSSGSNDVFDDIFDSWTGDSVFGNLLKMNSAFSRFAKDSLRRDRRRESLRRPKSDRTTTRPSRDWTRAEKLAAGHSTDRESSDNEDDFDFHFDGSHPISYGSQGLTNFMKAMHLNFNDHLRSFKDRHRQGSFSRSLSRDRDESSRPRDLRGRSDSKSGASGYNTMNRSTSRDRTSSSPRESVLRFVADPPRRQDSTRSEPKTYHQRMNSWGSRERLGRDVFDDSVRESGVGSSWDGYTSDHGAKYSSPIDSPDTATDRGSFYSSGRPKGFQRYRESLSKEGGESPSTPQSTRSGPDLLDRSRHGPEGLSDNRRRRVEHWLETNPEDLIEPDVYSWTTRSLLRDMPEFSSLYEGLPRPKSGFTRYSRSSSDKLADFDERPSFPDSGPTSRDRVSSRSPMFRTISEVQVSGNPRNPPQDPSLRDHYDFGSAGTLNDPPVAEKPPKMTRATSQGSATFTRSSSGNPTHVEIVTNPDGSLEMETPVTTPRVGGGPRTPVLRMRVSFNGPSESSRESPVWSGGVAAEGPGLWNQERPVSPLWSSDFQDGGGSSLLEALKNRGYRNVMSQRLQHNQYSGSSLLAEDGDREAQRVAAERGGTVPPESGPRAEPEEGSRGANEAADASGGSSTPKRGKACNSASSTPAETERDACCMMETNLPLERNVATKTVIDNDHDDDCNDELDRSEHSEEYVVEKITRKIPEESPEIIIPVVTKLNGHHHGYGLNGQNGHAHKLNGEKNHRYHHQDEAASDGTLTPDSLDSSKEKAARRASKTGYEEESVSERILRKSFYSRFNEDRPKRRSFVYQDTNPLDYSMQDIRGSVGGGLWSRFSDPKTDSILADDPYSSPLIRRANRRASKTATPEKRSSANLEESSWLRKSDSNSSYNLYEDNYLSDDGLWASKPPLPSRRNSQKSTPNGSSSSVGRASGSELASSAWYEKPTGSLWNQQSRKDSQPSSRSYREPSVIDTVPDLSESRRSSRTSFSFYSPTVTPRSPVFSSRSLVDGIVSTTVQSEETGSIKDQEPKVRRRSLVEPQFVVREETRSRQSSGSSSSIVRNGSSEQIKPSTTSSTLNDNNNDGDFDVTLLSTANNITMIKPKEAILSSE